MSQLLDPPGADAVAVLESLAVEVDRLQRLLGMADPGAEADVRHEVAGTTTGAATPAAGGAGLWRLGSGELLETAAEVHALGCRLEAVLHVLVAEADVRGAAGSVGRSRPAAGCSTGWGCTRAGSSSC